MAEHSIDLISVATLDEVIADPQVRMNGYLLPLAEPLGPATHTVNSPVFIDGENKRDAGHAPELGQHTQEVLATLRRG
jgi:formyl-CoA transferase